MFDKMQYKLWKHLNKKMVCNKYYSTKRNTPFDKFTIKQNDIEKKLMLKVFNREKIRVAFFIFGEFVFPGKTIYEKMLKNPNFEPFIVVIVDYLRGAPPYSWTEKVYHSIAKKYEKVYLAFNPENGAPIDFSDKCDIAFFSCPYEEMLHPYNKITTLSKKDILICYLSYYYQGRMVFEEHNYSLDINPLFWKIFVENKYSFECFSKLSKNSGKNCVLTSYLKMDSLSKYMIRSRKRKRIILSPHHSILKDGLAHFGSFLMYADMYLKLPSLYPNIDFVFRPHQLLRQNLNIVWGTDKTNEYYNKMSSYDNVEYQIEEDYLDTFVNSDAMIHDCGSFLAEYFYTDHPQCYCLKDEQEEKEEFLSFGQEMLKQTYRVYDPDKIIEFIDNVVLAGKDPLKQKRRKFFNKEIKLNYPKSTDFIIDYIEKQLKITTFEKIKFKILKIIGDLRFKKERL